MEGVLLNFVANLIPKKGIRKLYITQRLCCRLAEEIEFLIVFI